MSEKTIYLKRGLWDHMTGGLSNFEYSEEKEGVIDSNEFEDFISDLFCDGSRGTIAHHFTRVSNEDFSVLNEFDASSEGLVKVTVSSVPITNLIPRDTLVSTYCNWVKSAYERDRTDRRIWKKEEEEKEIELLRELQEKYAGDPRVLGNPSTTCRSSNEEEAWISGCGKAK